MSKSDGVADIVKWLEEKCKEAKRVVDETKKSRETCSPYDWEIYDDQLRVANTELSTLVSVKRSTEKYMKKLRHEGQ